ncbi:Glycosyl transferase, family 4, conserved region [Coriobacterium glomerans PW2]|uniref:Glycosyl transferase, family 4, conserved region n=1 Tax=Coriobacterium glomerans (strain ATCC 49209 / DSM 20642 / JCM 10262 / PW2) TaxID=700015 RepID=F2N7G1_CORGP|nr:MraY family glycosyltransferase [Coriobacterium glomerans]AEB06777.1 Glycosyl transferase, family 4, conserved region [Coriobacterium glomerans PW2]
MTLFAPHICIALVAFATTFAIVPAAKRLAFRIDAVDYPSKRRVNTVPVARLGGIAVFCGLTLACAVQVIGTKLWGWPSALIPHPSLAVNYPALAIAFLVVFITGVVDDIFQLTPHMKLIGQLLGAIIAASGGLTIGSIVNPLAPGSYIHLGWLAWPITVLYLVAYANIINLIDGLDGLATGISAISSATMFSFAVLSGRNDAAALSIALFGACVAFLRYNFHPASIFLGDSGALLLGFGLGSISLLSVSRTAALTSLLMPLIVAGVPIIDTLSAIVRRMRAHVSIGQADKGHIHHRLIQEGYDQRQAVMLIYAWCILLSLGAIAINQVDVKLRILIFFALLACSALFAARLHLFEPVLRHHYNPKTREDEIVSPENPAFREEARACRRAHARRLRGRRARCARNRQEGKEHDGR